MSYTNDRAQRLAFCQELSSGRSDLLCLQSEDDGQARDSLICPLAVRRRWLAELAANRLQHRRFMSCVRATTVRNSAAVLEPIRSTPSS
eukprot:1506148-Pleurochrysis_carterae.AAC.1